MRESRLEMKLLGLSAAALLALFATAASAADAAHGKQIFASCAACHSERTDAIGPDLKGIVGRKSAAAAGTAASAATITAVMAGPSAIHVLRCSRLMRAPAARGS